MVPLVTTFDSNYNAELLRVQGQLPISDRRFLSFSSLEYMAERPFLSAGSDCRMSKRMAG